MDDNRSNEKDYYVILGVLPTASPADITAAYYVLACKYHPDTAGADPARLSKLKRLNEAYEVLSDEQKRRDYDRRFGSGRRSTPAASATAPDVAHPPKPTTPLYHPNASALMGATGALDVEVELPVTPEEARYGGPCDFVVTVPRQCGRCSGRGRIADTRCDGCLGKGKIRERRCLRLGLPHGLRTGSMIRIPGLGQQTANVAGDLLVRIKILPCW